MIWGYDDLQLKFFRWRNNGIIPHFNPVDLSNETKPMLSSSPILRLDALRKIAPVSLDASAEAAILLCHLDRLAIQYGPPLHQAAEISMLDEVEVIAASAEAGGRCKILVRGQILVGCEPGVNVVVLDDNFIASEVRNFATHEDSNGHESVLLATFIERIEEGSTVLVGSMGDASVDLSARAKAALRSIGAAEAIKNFGAGDAFALIGQKGQETTQIAQKICSRFEYLNIVCIYDWLFS